MTESLKPELLTAVAAVIIALTGMVTAFGVIILGKMKQIHILVNSQYGDSLFVGMVAARALFEKDRGSEENKRLLAVAEQKYADHVAKQTKVDTNKR